MQNRLVKFSAAVALILFCIEFHIMCFFVWVRIRLFWHHFSGDQCRTLSTLPKNYYQRCCFRIAIIYCFTFLQQAMQTFAPSQRDSGISYHWIHWHGCHNNLINGFIWKACGLEIIFWFDFLICFLTLLQFQHWCRISIEIVTITMKLGVVFIDCAML